MAEITAALVKRLRDRTDLPMMDCKQALAEVAGDLAAAEDLLRRKFAAKAAKRADRETAEGRIGISTSLPGAAALAEVRCETAPVAANQVFVDMANKIASAVAASGVTELQDVMSQKVPGAGTVQDAMHEAFGKIQENMKVARVARLEGAAFAGYVHFNGKIGVVCAFDADPGELGKQICMHVAHSRPAGLGRADIPAVLVDKERLAARETVPPGKPAEIIDKIVDGRLTKWYAERVLLEQPFVMDEKQTVGQILKKAGRTLTGYRRLEVGLLE